MLGDYLRSIKPTSGQTNIENVFSAYTYTGNGSTQTITNGIDLAGQGGMVWFKRRDAVSHQTMWDYAWVTSVLRFPNLSLSQGFNLGNFNSDGFFLNSSDNICNAAAGSYISWTFRQSPLFFSVKRADISSDATVLFDELGTIGMVVVQGTFGNDSPFHVWHRSCTSGKLLQMNSTAAEATSSAISVSGTTVTLPASAYDGGTVVVYAWAHDSATTSFIQCGSFTTDGSGNASVTLGWEPQFVLTKASSITSSWRLMDTARNMSQTNASILIAESSAAEGAAGSAYMVPTATGFTPTANAASTTYVYLAIRRGPMAAPTSGTQVFHAAAHTASDVVITTGFPPDMIFGKSRGGELVSTNDVGHAGIATRLTRGFASNWGEGAYMLYPHNTISEDIAYSFAHAVGSTGYKSGYSPSYYGDRVGAITYAFRRYPGVFDVVCYTGNGSYALQTINHNLGVAPEMIIVKSRGGSGVNHEWGVYHKVNASLALFLNSTAAYSPDNRGTPFTNITATSITPSAGMSGAYGISGTYVAYLFATKAGISKVGSYTGNGTNQTIDCGFSAGARFVLIKRTDSTGDWYVWDSTRGIVAGNDPHLSLNTTAAEVTSDDSVDPAASGFIVNQLAATNINVNAASYIYLAIS
jgi:hypothetical protein